jgi:hypothetical protein
MVERSSKTKKTHQDLSFKIKTQMSEKRRKKRRSGNDAREIADSVQEVMLNYLRSRMEKLKIV